MLGLESWIPIYMTGQVSPFYLKGIQNSVYCHLNYCSGNVALTDGRRHNLLSSLPLYTMTDELLSDILKRHFVFDTDGARLLGYVAQQRSRMGRNCRNGD